VTRIEGDLVLLRSFRTDELERLLEIARATPTGDGVHWGPRGEPELRAKISESGKWSNGQLTFAMESDGRLVGEIQARGGRGALPPGVFELGIELYDEADRARGLGSSAVRAITRHLFEREEALRVQVSTDVENVAMRRTAEGLGFLLEGVLRGFMPTRRGPRDYAMYAMTRSDWESERNGWIRTS
jgi:RimJ/RimL family protein N-acetyltransferase